MRSFLSSLVGLGLTLSLIGCTPPMAGSVYLQRTLAAKAAFDLHCSPEQLQYTDLGGETVGQQLVDNQPNLIVDGKVYEIHDPPHRQQGVKGCGRQASYAWVKGSWVGNGEAPHAP